MKLYKIRILREGEFDKLKSSDIERLKLITLNNKLTARVASLQREIEAVEVVSQVQVPIDLGDPAPEKEEEYNSYVARVAGFYKDIFEPKLKQMLSTTHKELEDMGNDRDSDLILKGIAYAFREIMKWGNSMVSKQIAIQVENNKDQNNED